MHLVLKSFESDGVQRKSGELVDASEYKFLEKLISIKYLKESVNADSFRCEICSREFINPETLESHYIESHPDEIEIEEEGVEIYEPNIKGKGKCGKADNKGT